jgi:thiamine pyrophosphokinase
MNKILFTFQTIVTLVGAGPVRQSVLRRALGFGPIAIAADGGAHALAKQGHPIHVIIGDLDSIDITENWLNSGVQIHRIEEQETTDFEKCLYSVEAPLFLAVGFVGGATDHALAAMNAVFAYENKRIILLGDDDLTFLCPAELEMDLPVGCRISLFPLVDVVGQVSRGLRWNVAGMRMQPGGQIGVSNQVSHPGVNLSFDRRGVLVTLPIDQLPAAIAALRR